MPTIKYFVDSRNGNDANNGLSEQTAKRTWPAASLLFSGSQAGVYCGLARGSEFIVDGNTINVQGAAGNYANIVPYGSGPAPRFSAATTGVYSLTLNGCQYLNVKDIRIISGEAGLVFSDTCANVEVDGLFIQSGFFTVLMNEGYGVGIDGANAQYITIKNFTIVDLTGDGITLGGAGGAGGWRFINGYIGNITNKTLLSDGMAFHGANGAQNHIQNVYITNIKSKGGITNGPVGAATTPSLINIDRCYIGGCNPAAIIAQYNGSVWDIRNTIIDVFRGIDDNPNISRGTAGIATLDNVRLTGDNLTIINGGITTGNSVYARPQVNASILIASANGNITIRNTLSYLLSDRAVHWYVAAVGATLSPDYNLYYPNNTNADYPNGRFVIEGLAEGTLSVWQLLGGDAHSLGVDPLMVAPSGYVNDLRVYGLSAGSPAIGAGTRLSSLFTHDYFGRTRSTWDIGAIAYIGSSAAPTNRVFRVPQISLPLSIKFSDCAPTVYTPDDQLAIAYIINKYTRRSAWSVFNKGPLPPPFVIKSEAISNGAEYSIFFNNFIGGSCEDRSVCDLICTSANITFAQGSNPTIDNTYCNNGERPAYHFYVTFSSDDERDATPVNLTFTYSDANGNTREESIQSIRHIKPHTPIAGFDPNSDIPKAYIGMVVRTVGGIAIDQDYIERFVIQRCKWPTKTGVENFYIDRSDMDGHLFADNLFTDIVTKGEVYGYRVAFINTFNEQTEWSDWKIVSAGASDETLDDTDVSDNWLV